MLRPIIERYVKVIGLRHWVGPESAYDLHSDWIEKWVMCRKIQYRIGDERQWQMCIASAFSITSAQFREI